MNQCSFGARMLGEVAPKIRNWIRQGRPIRVVYDGTALRNCLKPCAAGADSEACVRGDPGAHPSGFEHLVIGRS
jgi:hypothetical protein